MAGRRTNETVPIATRATITSRIPASLTVSESPSEPELAPAVELDLSAPDAPISDDPVP